MKDAYKGRLKMARVPPMRATPSRRQRRKSLADIQVMQIEEATNYDKDAEIMDPVAVIREFKRHPQFCEELRKLTEVRVDDGLAPEERANQGRPRIDGRWDLLYLAFVITRDPAVWSFCRRWASSPIWQECGFAEVPHYNTVRERFAELEEKTDGFKTVKQMLVRNAKRYCPQIGQFVSYDHTGWQSDALVRHAPPEICDKCKAEQAAAFKSGQKWKKPGRYSKRLDSASFESERQSEAEDEDFELTGTPASSLTSIGLHQDDKGIRQLFRDQDGHIHFSWDTESGVRKYQDKGSWNGGLGGGLVDLCVGVGLAFDAFRADDAEFNHYVDIFEDCVESTGEAMIAVSIDKGNAVRDFYEFNTRRGVATVGPRRIYKNRKTGPDWRTERFDEHGHPRCPNCNGEGLMDMPNLTWYLDRHGEPRLRFRCASLYDDACKGTHSIACDEEWLLLQPLTVTHEFFQALRHLHENLERVWGHYRTRYAFAGKNQTSRLKRLGVSPQRLRGNAALLIDWFRVSLRHGWIGDWPTRNPHGPMPVGAPPEKLKKLADIRRARGLDVPYGKRWERLKERMKKKRRPPHSHRPSATALPLPPALPPATAPPPSSQADGPKIWIPPPDLGRS